jgi:hypothetical protein
MTAGGGVLRLDGKGRYRLAQRAPAAIDLQGLASGAAAVGPDERVVDALGLEPGEQELAQRVGLIEAVMPTVWV